MNNPKEVIPESLPERIRKRLEQLRSEIEQILSHATGMLTTRLPGLITYRFEHSAPTPDVMSDEKRAQSTSFIWRYEHLPTDYGIKIVERDGQYHIGNFPFLRHALNDFRPIIQNESDATFYSKIHKVWYGILARQSHSEGLIIRVQAEDNQDCTPTFMAWLGEHNKAVTFVLRALDYDYLYNGILQHSDMSYSRRFWNDYTSGELNYILWKHMYVLRFIKKMLFPYYQMMNILTYPKLGPL